MRLPKCAKKTHSDIFRHIRPLLRGGGQGPLYQKWRILDLLGMIFFQTKHWHVWMTPKLIILYCLQLKTKFSWKSWKSRREREFHYQNLIIESRKRNLSPKSCKSRGEGEICLRYLENREEIEKFVSHILRSRRERENFLTNLENREEKETFNIKNLKKQEEKERRTRHENSLLQLERKNYESFLFKNFSRSRLLSMHYGEVAMGGWH